MPPAIKLVMIQFFEGTVMIQLNIGTQQNMRLILVDVIIRNLNNGIGGVLIFVSAGLLKNTLL
jgi:hypothetical protein